MRKIKQFFLQNTSVRQTVLKNTFWLFTGQIGSRLLRALIIIYAARVLGAADYGVFAYVLGVAGFFTIFADIGTNQILTRGVSQKPEEDKEYFATTLTIKTLLLAVVSAIVVFAVPYFSSINAVKPLLPFAAVLIIFDNLRELASAYFRGKEKMELEALLITATNLAIAIFGFVVLTLHKTPAAITTAYVLSAGAGTVLGIIILKDKFSGVFRYFRKKLIRPILFSAWPVALMTALGAFMLNTDVLMLGFFKTASDVGLYSASQKIIQVLYVLPAILATSFFPILSRLAKEASEKTSAIMERGIAAIFLVSLPVVVGGVILAKDILEFLYGDEYLPATLSFQILLLTPLLIFPGILINNYILAHDKQKKLAPIVAAGAGGNALFNLILIPPFGIAGCAIATVAAAIIYNGSAWRLAKKINNFTVIERIKKLKEPVVVMGLFVFALNAFGVHVLLTITLGGLFYAGTLFALKEQTLEEIRSVLLNKQKTKELKN